MLITTIIMVTISVHVYMYVYMYMCIYIYIYIHKYTLPAADPESRGRRFGHGDEHVAHTKMSTHKHIYIYKEREREIYSCVIKP